MLEFCSITALERVLFELFNIEEILKWKRVIIYVVELQPLGLNIFPP